MVVAGAIAIKFSCRAPIISNVPEIATWLSPLITQLLLRKNVPVFDCTLQFHSFVHCFGMVEGAENCNETRWSVLVFAGHGLFIFRL